MKLASKRLAGLVLARFARGAVAADLAPGLLVKAKVQEFLSLLQQTSDEHALRQFAKRKLLRRFDFRQMARLAMGAAWSKASLRQQRALDNGLRRMLLSSFSDALTAAPRELRIEVKPVRHSVASEVTVKTLIKRADKPAIAIDYCMHVRGSNWKVWDVLVDGSSLMARYRETLVAQARRDGIHGLIKALDAHRGYFESGLESYAGARA